ncbi:MAG: hypothetical protein JOZ67_00395 [Gammaproteobacteria bacterium]|nr:hypothetical protein [Gammaproteobacteria bacterium]
MSPITPHASGPPSLPALLLSGAAVLLPGTAGAQGPWRFDVRLDGRPIGFHEFQVQERGEETEVLSRAHFLVTVLRVPLYRYEHEDHETWRAGCLVRIEATTNDNGRRTQVRGAGAAQGFAVMGPAGASHWPGCVRSFAYWDTRLLDAPRLLNAQTGEYEAVQVTRIEDPAAAAGATAHYRLTGEHFHIDLWYGAHGEWRALESRTPEGRTLRYEISP